jgi:flagellar basal-body rod modification protein FlgD
MMSVNPLNSQPSLLGLTGGAATTGSTSATTASSGNNPASQLGESAFLTLLSAELQYQDPLQPMDNTQFVAELAQFSQLSAVNSQTSTLQQILAAVQGGGSIVSASQLIGKTVTTSSGQTGQVTGVTSAASGLSFDVSGVGTVPASSITAVTESGTSAGG